MNLIANSESSVLRWFRKRQEWSYPLSKWTRKSNFGKKCFILYFYSDKLNHYKTYDFRKFFIPDAFKHVRLQNTLNSCKVHQILPLKVDYVCFLVKCINYPNIMCVHKFYFLQNLARFLQVSFLNVLARLMQESCKIFLYLQKNSVLSRFLQENSDKNESCKILATNLRRII